MIDAVYTCGTVPHQERERVVVVGRDGGLYIVDPGHRCLDSAQRIDGEDPGNELYRLERDRSPLAFVAKVGLRVCEAHGAEMVVGYRKKGQERTERRRLKLVVPTEDGQGLIGHDLDRNAPRRFNLDRIQWVINPGARR